MIGMRGLSGFQPLSRAERMLVEGLDSGGFDRIGAGGLPEAGDPAREVRAELIRLLILGGPETPRLHERGLLVSGAWVTGPFDLEGCRVARDIGLVDCRFEASLVLRSAIIDTLFLDGSDLPGLIADRLEARGGLYLRATRVRGAVRLPGARLGGELVCDGATLEHPGDMALEGEGLAIGGGVLLRGAVVRGGLSLPDAKIGGNFNVAGATIDRPGGLALNGSGIAVRGDLTLRLATVRGEMSFVGARVGADFDLGGGSFEEPGGFAIRLTRASVEGAFFLREGATVRGALSLNGTSLGAMVDDPPSWPAKGDLLLNRCLYGAFLGAPVDAAIRLDWLARQTPARWGEDFWPQPYEQLAAVLYEMGHEEDARQVLIAKERLQRRARRDRAGSSALRAALWMKDTLVGATVLYGRQPLLAFAWLFLFWAIGAALFAAVAAQAAMRPNIPVLLRSPEWVLCAVEAPRAIEMVSLGQVRTGLAAPGQSQLACYNSLPEAASLLKFNPWMYSLDVLLPALETGQKEFWSPDTRHAWGIAGKTYQYFETLCGWVLSLLAVAGFSGIVKSR